MRNSDMYTYSTAEFLALFTARYEIANMEERTKIKEILKEYCIGGRAMEACFGQFIAQIEHNYEERMRDDT